MSPFNLKQSRDSLDQWFLKQKPIDRTKMLYHLMEEMHNCVSSFEYELMNYTTPIFSNDVAKIVDEYTMFEIDWKSYDLNMKDDNYGFTSTREIDDIYMKLKRELESLIRERNAGFRYQAETVCISWYDEGKLLTRDYHKVNLFELDLPCMDVSTINIVDLHISNGRVEDLWKFIVRNSHAIKNISIMTFQNQRLHECDLIGYMDHMIRPLLYEMSNNSYASYRFSSYSMRGGETRLDLHKFLCEEEKNNTRLMKGVKSQFSGCLRELTNRVKT